MQTRLRLGHDAQALEAAAKYQDIFGKENYFLELMDHGLDIEKKVRDGLVEIGRKLGIPPVVTNDSHYTHEAQSEAHDVLLCVQTGSNVADPNRFKFGGSGYYIKSADEMRGVDGSDVWLEGCRNTLLVAERVDPTGMFEFHNLMPRFPVPEGETEESWFRKETFAGLARRYPGASPRATWCRPSTSWASSSRWASRRTSSWWPTSSSGPRRRASPSVPAVGPRPVPLSRTPWASRTWTRSRTG
ncbi:hypothetical protein GCM10029963_20150 [Micromonospora andamanensis]